MKKTWGVAAVAAMLCASCSFNFSIGNDRASAAKDLITEDLAAEFGESLDDTTCDDGNDVEVGGYFSCKSTVSGGVIDWRVDVKSDDKIDVNSTNLLTVDNLTSMRKRFVADLNGKVDQEVPVEALNCGDKYVIVANGESFDCDLTDNEGVEYVATITMTDVAEGTFEYNVVAK